MQYTRSLSAQAMARVVYVLSGTVVFVVLARVLGPGALGAYVYAINLVTILTSIADLGSTGMLARDLVASGAGRPVYLANFIALRGVLGLAVGLVGVPVALWLLQGDVRLVVVLCCLLLPLIAARFFDPVFQVGGRPWLSLGLTGGFGGYLLVASVAVALVAADPVPLLVLVFAVGASGYGLVGLWLTWRLMPPDWRGVTLRGMGHVTVSIGPYAVSGLFAMLAVRLDVFLVAALGSVAMVGQYNAAFRFVDLGMAVIITVVTPLVTVFAQLAAADRAALLRAFQAMMRFVAMWCTAVAVLAPTLSPLVVRVLYGEAFAPTAPVLDLLAWKFQIAFCNLLCFALLMSVRSIQFTWWNSLQALLLNVALNAVMIPSLGIRGSGIASILSELSQTAVDVWFVARAMGNVFDLGWWRRLLAATVAAAVVVRLPLGLDPIWLALPGLLAFVGVMHVSGGLPSNPLATIRRAEGAALPAGEIAGGP